LAEVRVRGVDGTTDEQIAKTLAYASAAFTWSLRDLRAVVWGSLPRWTRRLIQMDREAL